MAVFERVLAVNARGVMQAMKAGPGMPAYEASKHAIAGMTRLAAIEYVTDSIRVNVVAHAPVMTPMVSSTSPER